MVDPAYYLNTSSDLDGGGVIPLFHYWANGAMEWGSNHPLFDTPFYLTETEPPEFIDGPVLLHYLKHSAPANASTAQ